jgi:hypothetical protein
LIAWYDFDPPKYAYSTTNPGKKSIYYKYYDCKIDIGPNGNNLNNMALLGTWTGNVDNGLNPIHVDRQGLFFDTAARQLISGVNFQVNSFTVEAWVRFNATPLANGYFVVRKAGMFSLYFDSTPIKTLKMMMNGNTITMNTAFVN